MNDCLTSPKLETPALEFTGQNGIILKRIEQSVVTYAEISSTFLMKICNEVPEDELQGVLKYKKQ